MAYPMPKSEPDNRPMWERTTGAEFYIIVSAGGQMVGHYDSLNQESISHLSVHCGIHDAMAFTEDEARDFLREVIQHPRSKHFPYRAVLVRAKYEREETNVLEDEERKAALKKLTPREIALLNLPATVVGTKPRKRVLKGNK